MVFCMLLDLTLHLTQKTTKLRCEASVKQKQNNNALLALAKHLHSVSKLTLNINLLS